ncbi:unnamed protein product [Mytilus coruscus]|uniref:Uncharacterized protein n=1 Tax=Mytilus coruscus TaxID=42192 RepID=A0A6J8C7L8_MYTCO|nr:unnamed protein product [Mytilus coruscus]
MLDDKVGQGPEMARRTTGQVRKDRQNVDLDQDARIQPGRKMGVSFSKRDSRRRQLESLLRFSETTDATTFHHRKGILEGVMNDRLFGMVECDIRVPDVWPSYFQHPTMTPFEYLEDMSPLFCSTDVPFDIIGEHMLDHVRRFELSEKPRRLLIGGMRARQMLIATPLLKWCLQHGMVVSKIYQVVEFTPQRCFRDFVKTAP